MTELRADLPATSDGVIELLQRIFQTGAGGQKRGAVLDIFHKLRDKGKTPTAELERDEGD